MKTFETGLTELEMELVSNAEWIRTKNRIIEKVYQLLGSLCENLQQSGTPFPDEVYLAGPKISRGEKYQELPYVILDQPRLFGKTDTCAVRTLFWWGHYFMITLHLKGRYAEQYIPVLHRQAGTLTAKGFAFCVNGEEWDHEWKEENYQLLTAHADAESVQKLIRAEFYKLSVRVPFNRWKEMNDILLELHRCLLAMLAG